MILLSSPLKMTPPRETTVSIFFLEIEIVTTKIVNSKSLKKICCQLLSTMNVLKYTDNQVQGDRGHLINILTVGHVKDMHTCAAQEIFNMIQFSENKVFIKFRGGLFLQIVKMRFNYCSSGGGQNSIILVVSHVPE